MKKKRLWAWFMAAVMAIGLMPATALADDATGGTTDPTQITTSVSNDENKTIQITKSLNDANDAITMEAYVKKDAEKTTTPKPLDIVLVLDVSGSMEKNGKMGQLKTAVNDFIDTVAGKSEDHRISIVKFAGNKTNTVGNDMYEEVDEWHREHTYNYSQIVKELTYVTTDGKNDLKAAVDALEPKGATQADYGLELAQTVLEDDDDTRGKVVIMFTDGEPTSASDFDYSVATKAVNTAKELKNAGTTIFTIGMFGETGRVPEDDDDFWNGYRTRDRDKYMYAVSSRYPKATAKVTTDLLFGYVNGWKVTPGAKAKNDIEYYSTAKDAAELNKIFQTISSEILKVTADAESKLTDTLTEYFDFADGIMVDKDGVVTDGVTVKKVAKTATGWGEETDITKDVTVKVDHKKIEVTGFDYTAEENIVTDNSGYKLVLTFPIKLDKTATTWMKGSTTYSTNVVTNENEKAGLYGAKQGETSFNEVLNESPQISMKLYGVTYDANTTDTVTGEVPLDPKGYFPNTKAEVLDNEFNLARDGYAFAGWSETPDGTTPVGSTVTIGDEEKILYAIWLTNSQSVTLTYDGNGGVDSKSQTQITQNYGKGYPVIVAENSFTREGYAFVGWSDTPNGEATVQPWSTFTITENKTLYAIWSETIAVPEDVKLTYHSNYGDSAMEQQKEQLYGKYYTVIAADAKDIGFAKEGFSFAGWSLTPDGDLYVKQWGTFNITDNTDLYAIWEKDTPTDEVTVAKSIAYEENNHEQGYVYKDGEWITFKIVVKNTTNGNKELLTLTEHPGAGLTNGFWYLWDLKGNHADVTVSNGEALPVNVPYTVNCKVTRDANNSNIVKIENLGPNETCTIYYRAKVNIQQPYNENAYKNYVTVDGKDSNEVIAPVIGIDITKEVVVDSSTNETKKTKTVKRGEQVLYKIVVTNPSSFELNDVVLTESPEDAKDDSNLLNGYFCNQKGEKLEDANVHGNVYNIDTLGVAGSANSTKTLYYTAKVSSEAKNNDVLTNNVKAEAQVTVQQATAYALSGELDPPATTIPVTDKDSAQVTVKVSSNNNSGGHRKHRNTKVDEVLNTEDHFQYVQGYPDDTVRPERNITRAEATVIFFRLLQDSVREKYMDAENSFPDVNAADWFNLGISTMENGNFVSGYEDGTFRPNGYITRAELATIISNFDDLEPATENKFADVKGHWAEAYINSAAEKGWLSGYEDGLFRPNQLITRAETMSMINRVLNRSVDADGLHKDAKQWQDNPAGKWYYYAVLEATNPHEYERKDTKDVESWTAITAEKIWEN